MKKTLNQHLKPGRTKWAADHSLFFVGTSFTARFTTLEFKCIKLMMLKCLHDSQYTLGITQNYAKSNPYSGIVHKRDANISFILHEYITIILCKQQ